MESFNQLLNNYIRRAGISDTELARALGVSRQTIFRWREGLTGRPRQREDVLVIARKLRLTPEERDKLLLSAGFRPEEEGGEDARTRGKETFEGEIIVSSSHASSPLVSSPQPRLRRLWGLLLLGGGLLLVMVAWGITWVQNNSQATITPSVAGVVASPPTPARPSETVILITHFANYASSQVGYNVAGRLAQALQQEVDRLQPTQMRIVIWPQPVGERGEALQAGQAVSATLVIYGEYDVGRIVVEFAQPADQDDFADPALQRHVADVPDLSAAINGDLPQQVRSLALLALGQIYLKRGQADQARPLLAQARANLETDPAVEPQTWALVNFYLGLTYLNFAQIRGNMDSLI